MLQVLWTAALCGVGLRVGLWAIRKKKGWCVGGRASEAPCDEGDDGRRGRGANGERRGRGAPTREGAAGGAPQPQVVVVERVVANPLRDCELGARGADLARE